MCMFCEIAEKLKKLSAEDEAYVSERVGLLAGLMNGFVSLDEATKVNAPAAAVKFDSLLLMAEACLTDNQGGVAIRESAMKTARDLYSGEASQATKDAFEDFKSGLPVNTTKH